MSASAEEAKALGTHQGFKYRAMHVERAKPMHQPPPPWPAAAA